MPRPRTVDDEQILVAAARAVGDVGPARLTLADVGRRAGLSPATLLQRFGSKRGLLLALAASGIETMPARIRAAADGDHVLDSLVGVLAEFTTTIEQPAQFANHLSFLLLDLSDPDFQALSRRHAQGVQAAITDVLQAAADRGELIDADDAQQLSRLVHAVYNGALLGWGMSPDGRPADAVRSALLDLLQLLAPRAAGPARRGRRRPTS